MRNPKNKPFDSASEERRDERERPHRRRNGREHAVHVQIMERHFAGGPAPTQELLAVALDQWRRLPGSIVRPPTDITLPDGIPPISGTVDDEATAP